MATENVLATSITLGTIGAGLLQWLKSRAWLPFIHQHSTAINHAVLLLTSALTGLGIHFAWNAGAHSLNITGLDLAAIAAAAWLWAKQWTVQFLIHRGLFGSVASPAASGAAATALPPGGTIATPGAGSSVPAPAKA